MCDVDVVLDFVIDEVVVVDYVMAVQGGLGRLDCVDIDESFLTPHFWDKTLLARFGLAILLVTPLWATN
ncbi:hypothetical protein Sbal678_3493 [Shewanella baltica OS678]|nr:hypothetical protein Sbal678_3493 [Shewanella baltica OS678]